MQHNTMQHRADRTALSSDNFADHPRINYPIPVIGHTKTVIASVTGELIVKAGPALPVARDSPTFDAACWTSSILPDAVQASRCKSQGICHLHDSRGGLSRLRPHGQP